MSATRWRLLAEGPAVVAGVVVMLTVASLAPPPIGPALFCCWLGLVMASPSAACERVLASVVLRGRRLTVGERYTLSEQLTRLASERIRPPGLDVFVVPRSGVGAEGFGRRTLLVTSGTVRAAQRGKLTAEQVTALLMSGVGQLQLRVTRFDGPVVALGLPCLPIRVLIAGVGGAAAWMPDFRLAWRVRGVVMGVAVWQSFQEGHPVRAVGVGAMIAISYLHPLVVRRAARMTVLAGDRFATDHGYAPALASALRTLTVDDFTVERIGHLAPPPRPVLRLVR